MDSVKVALDYARKHFPERKPRVLKNGTLIPPRFTMEEYLAMIDEACRLATPEEFAQKRLEKQITRPFKWVDEKSSA